MKELKEHKVLVYSVREVNRMRPVYTQEGENWFHQRLEKQYYGYKVITSLHEWSTDYVYVIMTKIPKDVRSGKDTNTNSTNGKAKNKRSRV